MASELITEKDLQAWLGFTRRGDIENWLKARKVPYDYGKGGDICTTVSCINLRLIGESSKPKEVRFS